MAATLSNVKLIVSDLDRALAFYVELLGLRVDADRSSPPGFVLLRAGACTLTIQAVSSAPGPAGAGPGMELGFEVLDLNDVAARLTTAGYADAPVQTVVGWGRALQARDPDGHRLNLFTTRES